MSEVEQLITAILGGVLALAIISMLKSTNTANLRSVGGRNSDEFNPTFFTDSSHLIQNLWITPSLQFVIKLLSELRLMLYILQILYNQFIYTYQPGTDVGLML